MLLYLEKNMAINLNKKGYSYTHTRSTFFERLTYQIGNVGLLHTGQYCKEKEWKIVYTEVLNSEIFKALAGYDGN